MKTSTPTVSANASTPTVPADTSAVSDSLKIGDIIKKRFILVEELGRGGMGVVYKAKDLRMEEAQDRNPFIALKVLSDNFKKNPDSFIALQRETRKTRELAHPNIVTAYDFDRDGEHVYMTMECLDGKPLSLLLHEHHLESWSLKERWSLIKQLCSALAYAHKKNIIHLDLKPGNICIKKDRSVKVLDFGIARASKKIEITETTTQDTTIFDAGKLGALTPPYASCEMLENQEPDCRDDIYALGCVIYEILTNHHPFNKLPATEARFNKITPPPIQNISKKQNKALMHALAFNREERVSTIDQFLLEAQLSISSTSHSGIMFPWKWISIVLFLSIPAGIIWLDYNKTIVDKYLKPSEHSAKNNSDVTNKSPLELTILPTLSDKDKQKILRLLEIAEMHFMVGKLVEPKGTNALEAYKEVLLLSPNNQAALEGLNNIASDYEQQANEQWNKGESTSSIVLLKKGLLASPLHQGLNELLRTINTEGK